MDKLVARLPDGATLHRRRGAFAGFALGVIVPVVIAMLFVVSLRGHGIMDSAQPIQVYSAF